MELNEKLRKLRQEKNVSIYKLSRMVDISENHIRSIEAGKTQPSIAILEKLLVGLGSNLAQFFSRDELAYYPTELERKMLDDIRGLDLEQVEAIRYLIRHMNRR